MKEISYSHHIKWHPPRPNFVKLNFNSYVDPNHNVVCGFVVRNELGSPLLAGSKNIGQVVPVAETRVVRDVLYSSLQKKFLKN